MRHLYYFLLLLCTCFAQAQQVQWHGSLELSNGHFDDRIFMGRMGSQMAVVYLNTETGSTTPEVTLGVLDACGESLTTYPISGPGFTPNHITNVVNDAVGNLYICGLSHAQQPNGKVFLAKLSPQMNLLWVRQYTNQTVYPYSFEINEDNELFLLFNTEGNNHGNSLLKLNSSGHIIWAKSFGYSPIWGMGGPTSDGGCIHSTGSIVFKTNSNGDMQWRTGIMGTHFISAPVEIDNGYMLFQGYPNSARRSRVIMLDMDGRLRWASKSFQSLNAYRGEKISNTEVQFTGHGNSLHSSSPPGRALSQLRVNTSGQITATTLFYDPSEKLMGRGVDIASSNNDQQFVVERKLINNTEHHLVFTRFPEQMDSLNCYSTAPFEAPETTLAQDTALPLIQSKSMSFSLQDLQLQLGPPTVYDLNISCKESPLGSPFSLGNDTVLCPGEVVRLSGPPNYRYRWSSGQTSQQITVSQPGWYRLDAQYGCDTTIFSDSVYVEYYPQLELDIQFNKEMYYVGDTLFAEASGAPDNNYRWFLNGVEIVFGSSYSQLCTTPGQYTLRIVYEAPNGCSFILEREFTVRLRIPKVPNIFSPNGDGINDLFELQEAEGIHYSMQVYNRFGTLVAETDNAGWDGNTLLNQAAAEGVYFYLIYWEGGTEPFKGHLTLVR